MADPEPIDPQQNALPQTESLQMSGGLHDDLGAHIDGNHSAPSLRRTIIVGVLGVGLTLILLWGGGQWQRGSLQKLVAGTGPAPAPMRSLQQSGGNAVLILEEIGSQSRVYVQHSGQSDWLLVSFPDPQPQRPTLAADGKAIAYVASGEEHAVVWKAIDGSYLTEIDDEKLAAANTNLAVCPWTPASISPDNARIAFFGCDSVRNESVLLWSGVLTNSIDIVEPSRSPYTAAREVQWLNASQVMVTTQTGDDIIGTMVNIYDVQ